jgi:Bromodomain/TAZ zinc finger
MQIVFGCWYFCYRLTYIFDFLIYYATRLSDMAKHLEEHLYKTAKSKQEYMDLSTLRSRLFSIAQRMEGRTGGNENSSSTSDAAAPQDPPPPSSSSSRNNPTPQQKKVILQQQQRLLLLRHASKCKDGANCTTQFCGQISALWKHLRSCRNKDCTTPHCKTSRCVLNHYRACKTNKTFATCDVCGPFTKKIKQMDREDAAAAMAATSASSSSSASLNNNNQTTASAPESSSSQTAATVSGFTLSLQQSSSSNDQFASAAVSSTPPITAPTAAAASASSNSTPSINVPTLKGYLQHLQLLKRELDGLVEQERQLSAMPQNQDVQAMQEQLMMRQQRIQLQQQDVEHKVQAMLTNKNYANNSNPSAPPQSQSSVTPAPPSHHATSLLQPMSSNSAPPLPPQPAPAASKSQAPIEAPLAGSVKPHAIATPSGKGKRINKLLVARPAKKQRSSAKTSSTTKRTASTSLVSCMTVAEITKHLESLNKRIELSARTVTYKCRPLLQALIDDPNGWVFKDAVDPVALGVLNYFEFIKKPMHLTLVEKKLENAMYPDMESFASDVRLIFDNAILYNGESSRVGELAQDMLDSFNQAFVACVRGMLRVKISIVVVGDVYH